MQQRFDHKRYSKHHLSFTRGAPSRLPAIGQWTRAVNAGKPSGANMAARFCQHSTHPNAGVIHTCAEYGSQLNVGPRSGRNSVNRSAEWPALSSSSSTSSSFIITPNQHKRKIHRKERLKTSNTVTKHILLTTGKNIKHLIER